MAAFSMFTKFAESDRAWHKTAAKEIWFVPLFFWIYRLFQKGFLCCLCALSVLLLYLNSTDRVEKNYRKNIDTMVSGSAVWLSGSVCATDLMGQ